MIYRLNHRLLIRIKNIVRQNSQLINLNTTNVIHFSFHSLSMIFYSLVPFQVIWENEYGTWDPEEYNNIYLVSQDPSKIWRPRLTVLNTMKDLKPIGEEYLLVLSTADGHTIWYPAERFETFCKVDVTYFPFDIQVRDFVLIPLNLIFIYSAHKITQEKCA